MSNPRFLHQVIFFCIVGMVGQAVRASDDGQTTSRPQTAPASQPQSAPATQPQSAPASQPNGNKGLRPITLVVTDAKTQKPITEFVCEYDIYGANKNEDQRNYKGVNVQSPTGTFQIDAPQFCSISIRVKVCGYIEGWGYPRFYDWDIRSDDENRLLGLALTPGAIVRGVVKDAKTGRPVQNAEVCPIAQDGPYTLSSFPVTECVVQTDKDGRFEVHGVDIQQGISVKHSAYLGEKRIYLKDKDVSHLPGEVLVLQADGTATTEISLIAGKDMQGFVKDPAGKPIEGAKVEVFDKSTTTNADGFFTLKSVVSEEYEAGEITPWIDKEGYVREFRKIEWQGSEGLDLTLKPQREIVGRVLDEEGRPVRKYAVRAVPCWEDSYPRQAYGDVDDPEGRFLLRIDKDGLFWFGIKAEGHAFWETRRDTKEIVAPLDVRLPAGSSVRGKVVPPDGVVGPFQVRLAAFTPKEDRSNGALEVRESLARVDGTTGQDGTIQLDHVRPGGYILFLHGPTITPIMRWLVVEDKETNLGTLHLQGTGTVYGQAYHTGKGNGNEKTFSSGSIGCSFSQSFMASMTGRDTFSVPSLSFRTDENGKFRVDGVPVGNVSVYFAALNPWAHRVDCLSRYAKVAAGQATEVRFFEPTGEWDVPLRIKVGDSSNAHWASGGAENSKYQREKEKDATLRMRFRLEPISTGLISYPASEELEVSPVAEPVLHDVREGMYRLIVEDEEGRDVWGEQEIDVHANNGPVDVRLGAGSIIGRVDGAVDAKSGTSFWLAQVDAKAGGRLYRGHESDGHFALCYLHPGNYVLYAVNHSLGWCRVGPIKVNNDMVDVGVLSPVPGGTIAGRFKLISGKPMPYTIHAIDASGMDIDDSIEGFDEPEGTEFSFAGLGPGEWIVQLKGEDDVLAEGKVTVKTGETAHVELVWK